MEKKKRKETSGIVLGFKIYSSPLSFLYCWKKTLVFFFNFYYYHQLFFSLSQMFYLRVTMNAKKRRSENNACVPHGDLCFDFIFVKKRTTFVEEKRNSKKYS